MNEKNYQLIAFTEDGLSLDVRVDAEKETVWLTQAEMAELFGIERPVVLYHLRTIYRNEELSEEATCTKIVQVQNEGGRAVKRERPIYNLDVILSVGYRVNSKRGIAFRRWANTVLKQYLVEGYALNEKRLSALNRTVEVQRALLTHYAEGAGADSDEVIAVLDRFTSALNMLDDYDHQCLAKPKKNDKKIIYLDERNASNSSERPRSTSVATSSAERKTKAPLRASSARSPNMSLARRSTQASRKRQRTSSISS